jgi:hypothetical protein
MARLYAGRLHYGDNVELFAQASADALPSLKALKAIFGRLELFAGVGGRALVSLELRLRGGDQALVLFDGRAFKSRIVSQNRSSSLKFPSCTARCSSGVTMGMRACNAP